MALEWFSCPECGVEYLSASHAESCRVGHFQDHSVEKYEPPQDGKVEVFTTEDGQNRYCRDCAPMSKVTLNRAEVLASESCTCDRCGEPMKVKEEPAEYLMPVCTPYELHRIARLRMTPRRAKEKWREDTHRQLRQVEARSLTSDGDDSGMRLDRRLKQEFGKYFNDPDRGVTILSSGYLRSEGDEVDFSL